MKNSYMTTATKKIALVGVLAATIECGKLVLAPLPNIEIVTLLSALYGYAFGAAGVISTIVFVFIEPLIWGVGTWIPLYFIYWPLVSFVFLLFGKAKLKNRMILTAAALILTVFFGLLSSLIDVGLFSGYYDNFLQRFSVYYLRGLPFYIAQLVINGVLFPLLFLSLSEKLLQIKKKFLS